MPGRAGSSQRVSPWPGGKDSTDTSLQVLNVSPRQQQGRELGQRQEFGITAGSSGAGMGSREPVTRGLSPKAHRAPPALGTATFRPAGTFWSLSPTHRCFPVAEVPMEAWPGGCCSCVGSIFIPALPPPPLCPDPAQGWGESPNLTPSALAVSPSKVTPVPGQEQLVASALCPGCAQRPSSGFSPGAGQGAGLGRDPLDFPAVSRVSQPPAPSPTHHMPHRCRHRFF